MADGLRKTDYEVREVPIRVARNMIERYHYARGASNTAVFLHGLFRRNSLDAPLGVAWWLPPTKAAAIASYDGDWRAVLSLSRLVVTPEAPRNACSFLIGQSIKLVRADGRYKCLVTYADTWQGHIGTIYKATNWESLGLTRPSPVFVDTQGKLTARKAGPRSRTGAEMAALGCRLLGYFPKHKFRMVLA